ncbi:MAG: hypothetical protein HY060_20940 [Proteobacteria bacterium]|nr:hypothetical protein [Pseudomonadota bacterium]
MPEQLAGVGDHRLGRRRIVVADVVDRAGMGPRHRGREHGGEIVDVDAAEHLAGLVDALGTAGPRGVERATPGTVDAGEAEDVQRQAERAPAGLGGDPAMAAHADRA